MIAMFQKKKLSYLVSAALIGSAVLLTACDGNDGEDGAAGTDGKNAANNSTAPEGLKRFATAPLGAEFTGMFMGDDGTFYLNVQHPSDSNTTADTDGKVFNVGTVGAIIDAVFDNVAALDLPITTADKEVVKTASGAYKVLAQQGDAMADGNKMGDILRNDGATLIKNSNDPDFNAAVPAATGYYLYTNWEDRPGGMSRIQVNNGETVTQEGMLDFSSVNGTWVNCFGTLSPWGTPLSSEELYFDNTADWYDTTAQYFSNPQAVAEYRGFPTDGSGNWGNPYDYGYIVEIGTNGTVATANIADVAVNKLELMGRFSHENAIVMPDQRTVFLSDDGTGTILFKFIADTAGDMSSGTLYAAKVTQSDSKEPTEAAFAVSWVEVGSETEQVIETAIREFDGTFAEAKFITDEQIAAYAAGNNPFADDRIAFLESRKAAAAMGATAEFRKMEGININQTLAANWWNNGLADGDNAFMYLAMSSFDKTMSDDEGDIQLDGTNGKCGVVYRMKLVEKNGLVDIETLSPAIVGGPYDADNASNACSTKSISNPDNLVILDDGRALIGEDTSKHENNVIWLFDDPALK